MSPATDNAAPNGVSADFFSLTPADRSSYSWGSLLVVLLLLDTPKIYGVYSYDTPADRWILTTVTWVSFGSLNTFLPPSMSRKYFWPHSIPVVLLARIFGYYRWFLNMPIVIPFVNNSKHYWFGILNNSNLYWFGILNNSKHYWFGIFKLIIGYSI